MSSSRWPSTSSISGSGATGQVAVWSSSTALGGSSGLTYSGSALAITGNVSLTGLLGVGGSPGTSSVVTLSANALSGTDQSGFRTAYTINSAATGGSSGYISALATANSAFTSPYILGFYANDVVKGAASTITRQVHYFFDAPTSATNNAIISNNLSFTGNWFVNYSGALPSTIGGNITLTGGSSMLWTDGSGDVGAAGATRPNNVHVKTSLVVAATNSLDASTLTLNTFAISTLGTFSVSGTSVMNLNTGNNKALFQPGASSGANITQSSISFFTAPGGTGMTWLNGFNGNGVSTLALAGDNNAIGMYMTSTITAIPLKLVYNTTTAANAGILTLLNGPTGTVGNPTKYFRISDGTNDFVIPAWQV